MSTDVAPTVSTPPQQRPRSAWWAFAVLALALLMVSMDVSILYFAVPQIATDLHASAIQQLWIFDVYGFVLAGTLVTMGALADRFGARRMLLGGAVAFSLTSLGAAFASSAGQLIAARALLGVAGATLMPSTLSMIRTLFPDGPSRARAIGAWTGVMTAGVGLGPVLSGVLLAHFRWGSVFLVNLPAMALLLVAGPSLLPVTPRRLGVGIDLVSAALSLGAVLPTIYGIKQWAANGWSPPWPVAIVVGLSLGAVFVRRQRRHPNPMIDPALFAHRAYRAAVTGNLVAAFALIGNAVFMTAYLQLVLGYSPLTAALWSLLPSVGVGASAPLAPVLAARLGAARSAACGLLLAAGGFGLLATIGTHALVATLIGGGVLAAGLVVVMSLCGDAVLGALPADRAGAGAAVSEAASELGGALGIALLGSIGAAGYRAALGHDVVAAAGGSARGSLAGALAAADRLPAPLARTVAAGAREAYVHGLHLAAGCGAGLLLVAALVAVLVAWFSPRVPGRPGS